MPASQISFRRPPTPAPAAHATLPVCPTSAAIFLPKEHGAWSLALEPLALGLLIAPSLAGAALTTVAVIVFFARRPFKAALTSQPCARRHNAREVLMLLSALAVAGLLELFALGSLTALWPLLLVAPLAGLFIYFDSRGEARAAAAELAGSAAFALLPAACATLAGWSAPAALSLAAVALARSLPTVLTVRTYLRLEKKQPAAPHVALAAAGLGLLLIVGLALNTLVPWLVADGIAVLLILTAWLVSPLRPRWTPPRLGLLETALGLLYLALAIMAYRRH